MTSARQEQAGGTWSSHTAGHRVLATWQPCQRTCSFPARPERAIWKLSVVGYLHKEPSALAPCRGLPSKLSTDRHEHSSNTQAQAPRSQLLAFKQHSASTPYLHHHTHYHHHTTGLATYPPQHRQAGFLNFPVDLHHDALAEAVATPALPRPAAEQAAPASPQEVLRVAG